MQKSYRTKAKDAIMCYIKANKHRRFSASEIYQHIREEEERAISLTTIYRNLERLTDEGILLKIKNVEGECSFYQFLNADGGCDGHLHLQCKVCGYMVHIDEEAMNKANMYLLQNCGFSLICKDSVLMGYCDNCRSGVNSETKSNKSIREDGEKV